MKGVRVCKTTPKCSEEESKIWVFAVKSTFLRRISPTFLVVSGLVQDDSPLDKQRSE